MDEVFNKIKSLLAAQINAKKFNPDSITLDTKLDSLGLDSLDLAEVVLDVEEAFSLPEVSQEEMVNLKTVKDVVNLVQEKQQQK
ncbi:MAG: acyl carrier protein [Bacilli bacterium]|jgi:acyl carrier protein|nr:acyl carrier protein [Bacilli bacterium]